MQILEASWKDLKQNKTGGRWEMSTIELRNRGNAGVLAGLLITLKCWFVIHV